MCPNPIRWPSYGFFCVMLKSRWAPNISTYVSYLSETNCVLSIHVIHVLFNTHCSMLSWWFAYIAPLVNLPICTIAARYLTLKVMCDMSTYQSWLHLNRSLNTSSLLISKFLTSSLSIVWPHHSLCLAPSPTCSHLVAVASLVLFYPHIAVKPILPWRRRLAAKGEGATEIEEKKTC